MAAACWRKPPGAPSTCCCWAYGPVGAMAGPLARWLGLQGAGGPPAPDPPPCGAAGPSPGCQGAGSPGPPHGPEVPPGPCPGPAPEASPRAARPRGAVVCRFCLEDCPDLPADTPANEAARVVSPCACRGTSASVHLGCLRRWQAVLLGRRMTREDLAKASRCPVCKTALVVDGQELRPVLPPAVHAVRVGCLLVATEHLEGEGRTFHRSVVLVCHMEDGGRARGVDLTRPVRPKGTLQEAIGEASGAGLEVQAFFGGPTCGGRLGVVQYIVLGTFAEPWRPAPVLQASPQGSAAELYCPGPWLGLDAGAAAEAVRRAAGRGGGEKLLVFQGHAAWGRGQLEGEIHRGNWAVATAQAADVLEVPATELWSSLQRSGRLSRIGG